MSFLKKLFNTTEQTPAVEEKTEKLQQPSSKVQGEPNKLSVELDQIHLQQTFTNKEQVLTFIADNMAKLGFVNGNYLDALTEREEKVSTYLINGVAIPHGVNEAKALVTKTGVIIVQVPAGITWNKQGDIAKLIVGIAAANNDHLALLQKLTAVVMDQALSESLANTDDAYQIIQALGAESQAQPTIAKDFDTSKQATIVDKAGLHARPASLLAEQASTFANTEISIRNENQSANAKSMAALLTIGAKYGDAIMVSAQGEQAQAAVDTLVKLINEGLDNETDSENANYNPLSGLPALSNPVGDNIFNGLAASPGIAMANSYLLKTVNREIQQIADDPAVELATLQDAQQKAIIQTEEIYQKLLEKAPNEAAILKAQKQLLNDETINQESEKLITQGNSAAWAWQQSIELQIEALTVIEDERLRARIADLADIRERVINIILPSEDNISYPDTDFILLASDLTPSQTAGLEGTPIKGIATELGGPNSHMAILSRALGIPAVVGIGSGKLSNISEGQKVILDPQSATLIVTPDQTTQEKALQSLQTWQEMQEQEALHQHEPAITLDGRHIDIVCNIAKPQDAACILENGGEGAGLLRTEFLFESSQQEPSIEEQITALKSIAGKLGDKQLVIRTADIGGDKPVSWMDMPHEDNPFLGIRGVRLSFQHEDMFKRQLEAIYRTAIWQHESIGKCGIHIMFPMIAKISEWHRAKDLAELVRAELNAPKLPLGIMIEVPSAALVADNLAKEVDFFSIGSNDLTQYTLAMDRLNPHLCNAADSYHPGLLRLIKMTVDAADANGKWVGVCGNMAADPKIACLLVGLGVHELSVSPVNVPAVKNILRSVSFEKLQKKAQKALNMCSSESVMEMYKTHDDLL
ncbi:phosphoenolpyruvate--protein phosphotransferase [Psychromonas sp. RZ22]|uniref:phosphoenolpyruvate--protein phosphotransferase n=1 Tax=Psychromonas algarum TaxID=2555643 RepID=UPI001067DAC5|nr:phosphoenolpyruvate--protein phosphotransferase [Psychromonas sp. RZ22]TEW55524.1 phosphoenolpyruvate--protein phosphotransferase [Psychromonas sp. RZ22]